jgi:DNA (cytosine-5)-methyltransferase 1
VPVPKRVLDLCCGAGGAAMGLHQAWPEAHIVGMDIEPQPNYPFEFVRRDVTTLTLDDLLDFDFGWASPMCQKHSWSARRWGKTWACQIDFIRNLFEKTTDLRWDMPYVIENVVGAPLHLPFRLCGLMFGLKVIRHRLFEVNWSGYEVPEHPRCSGAIARGEAYTVAGHGAESKSYKYQDWADAMGIDWMTKTELTQAAPPAYAKFIADEYTRVSHI